MTSFGSVYENNWKTGQKFIGGAERTRREAQKKRTRPLSREPYGGKFKGKFKGKGKKQKSVSHVHGRIPKSLSPNERFFACLLTSSVEEVLHSNDAPQNRDDILRQICARAGVALPQALPFANYASEREYYDPRTALVLEEARHTLSDALMKQRKRRNSVISVTLAEVDERKKTGHVVLQFSKQCGLYGNSPPAFTQRELFDMRPGGCFQVDFTSDNLSGSVLASIVPQFQHDSSQTPTVTLMVYQAEALPPKIHQHIDDTTISWTIAPIGSLISHVRQFEACTRATKVAFLPTMLAHKQGTHVRFGDSDDEYEQGEPKDLQFHDGVQDEVENDATSPNATRQRSGDQTPEEPTCKTTRVTPLSKLNVTQRKAAKQFLESAESTLTLVQGPPGTGKTTFMSTVCYENWCLERRMLVSAPTNKAIGVVCSRFLELLEQQADEEHYCNAVLIGVEDKLVASEDVKNTAGDTFSLSSLETSVRRCFVYTWVQSLVRDLEILSRHLGTIQEEVDSSTVRQAQRLKKKLITSIPSLASKSGARHSAIACADALEGNDMVGGRHALGQWIKDMGGIDTSAATSELLATAHVIFCTLSTAGVSAMKQTRRIDDLLVDEAAAATEPELCIPFHLRPTRLLAVGDPLQLPALVVSPYAMQLGLARSLHQRLMVDCGDKDHIMLDVQYRMKPCISSFPSRQFYHGKLANGPNVIRPEHQSSVTILKGAPAYSFLQVEGPEKQQDGGSYSNPEEAHAVVSLVQMIRGKAASSNSSSNSNSNAKKGVPWYDSDKLRIITFYQGQVALIKQLLSRAGMGQVLVATVDSSQGCEADIVLVSFVRSNPGYGTVRRSAGFLADDRRINVAMTRARYQLVCVGDAKGTLSQSGATTLESIIQDANDRGCVTLAKDVLVMHKPPPPPAQTHRRLRRLDHNMQQLQTKEKLLNLHSNIAASTKASVLDKKQSLQMAASLAKEVHQLKKQRLDEMKLNVPIPMYQ